MKLTANYPKWQSCSNGPLLTVVVRRELLKRHRGSFPATFRKSVTLVVTSALFKDERYSLHCSCSNVVSVRLSPNKLQSCSNGPLLTVVVR